MSDAPAPTTQAPAATDNTQVSTQVSTQVQTEEKTEGQPKPEKRKIKVGNEFLDEDTIARDYSKWKGGDKALKEAAQARQSVEAFYEALQKDPRKVLADPRLPIDRRQLALDLMRETIEAEMLEADPNAKHMSETEKKLKEYQDKEAKQQQEHEQAEHQKLVQSRQSAIGQTLMKALEITPLSKNESVKTEVVAEMARYLRLCKQNGYEVTPDELAEHVARNRMSSYHTLAQDLDGDDLVDWLGDNVAQKILKRELNRIRKNREQPAPETVEEGEYQPTQSRKKREIIDPSQLMRRK